MCWMQFHQSIHSFIHFQNALLPELMAVGVCWSLGHIHNLEFPTFVCPANTLARLLLTLLPPPGLCGAAPRGSTTYSTSTIKRVDPRLWFRTGHSALMIFLCCHSEMNHFSISNQWFYPHESEGTGSGRSLCSHMDFSPL